MNTFTTYQTVYHAKLCHPFRYISDNKVFDFTVTYVEILMISVIGIPMTNWSDIMICDSHNAKHFLIPVGCPLILEESPLQ